VKIIRNINVNQVLTEKSKKQLHQKFEQQILQLKKEIDQLRFEKKKFEKIKKSFGNASSRFDQEISIRTEKVKLLEFQLEQLELLPIGTELKETEIPAIIEVSVGDYWDEITKDRTIVIKDGIVSEIR